MASSIMNHILFPSPSGTAFSEPMASSFVLYCTALFCIYSVVLCGTVMYCSVLSSTVRYCLPVYCDCAAM